ncbi:hypothetical protein, partial [Morganella morganii]|uniref:hypothetical protein n=1 Tax=Morganella morganii TaxID=582 RepID=UPI001C9CDD92
QTAKGVRRVFSSSSALSIVGYEYHTNELSVRVQTLNSHEITLNHGINDGIKWINSEKSG